MGVERAYISGLELGGRNPTIVTLWYLAKALGVKIRRFFEEERGRLRSRSPHIFWGPILGSISQYRKLYQIY
ncbi:MAG: helix-turn-helix transcriptional regulator [Alphaproteobacteria bacterium]|nr:helix-turn-helix transcriptional regulator [Alphaproteobacteria bacterium]